MYHPGGQITNYMIEIAQKKRISVSGAIAHIMVRGIEGSVLFHDDIDRH